MVAVIVLAGLHSTGKTTLANDLKSALEKRKYSVEVVSEVARKLMKEKGWEPDCVRKWVEAEDPRFLDFQEAILQRQAEEETRVVRGGARDVIIMDRGLDSLAYTRIYGTIEAADELSKTAAAQECLRRYRKGIVVFLLPVGPAHDDGTRLLSQDKNDQFLDYYESLLTRHHVPHTTLFQTDRHDRVVAMESLLEGAFPIVADPSDASSQPVCISTLKLRHKGTKSEALPYFEVSADVSGPACWGIRRTDIDATVSDEISKPNRFFQMYPEARRKMCVISFHPKVPSKVVHGMLVKPMYVNGVAYSFLACTSSGLKQRRCYMHEGTPDDIDTILKRCGDFDKITKVSKRLSRIGLLFSTCVPAVEVEASAVRDTGDVNRDGKLFTDGCGLIGRKLARQVMRAVWKQAPPPPSRLPHTSKTSNNVPLNLPSVIQIRFQGYKGVVSIDSTIPPNEIHLRESMKKFSTSFFPTLSVCDYAKPYKLGYLNLQFVRLLSGLGVPDDVFLERLDQHYDTLLKAQTDVVSAVKVLSWKGKFDVALATASLGEEEKKEEEGEQQQRQQHEKLFAEARRIRYREIHAKPEKLQILLHDARTLFGIADHRGLLDYGEVHVRVTIDGIPQTISGKVVVSKCPAYLLGDIRVLNAVSCKEKQELRALDDLVDCIVFPTKGHTPHPHEIAGSDLDGDQYFVCWDGGLIPPTLRIAYSYPEAGKRGIEPQNTHKGRIMYFSKQGGGDVGAIDSLFAKWADAKGVGCEQCVELGKVFSQAIDAAKTGNSVNIPKHLMNPPATDENGSKFVWAEMLGRAASRREELRDSTLRESPGVDALREIPIEFVDDMLCSVNCNVSEYQKFVFASKWCDVHEKDMRRDLDVVDHIDFGRFTADQIEDAIERGIPAAVVKNAANSSRLLTAELKNYGSLGSDSQPWRLWTRHSLEDVDVRDVYLALTRFRRVLLALNAGDGILVVLEFKRRCVENGITTFRNGSLAAYMHSVLFRKHYATPLPASDDKPYRVNLSEDLMQLYQGETKGNTFVWMKRMQGTEPGKNGGRSKGGKAGKDTKGGKGGKTGKNGGRSKGGKDEGGSEEGRGGSKAKVSIDLTRFETNIQKTPHPKVTKTPIRFLEVFVQDADAVRGCYDIYEVNNDAWVCEINDDDEDFDDDVDASLDWHPLLEHLTEAALSTTGTDNEHSPCSLATAFVGSLDEVALKFGHLLRVGGQDMADSVATLADVVVTRTVEAAAAPAQPPISMPQLLHLAAALCRLDCHVAAKQLLAGVMVHPDHCQADDVVDVALAWHHWACVHDSVVFDMLGVVCRACKGTNEGGCYITSQVLRQLLTLVLEMKTLKDVSAAPAGVDPAPVMRAAVCKLVSRDQDTFVFRLVGQASQRVNMTLFRPGTAVVVARYTNTETPPNQAEAEPGVCVGRIDCVDQVTLRVVVEISGEPQALLTLPGWDKRRWELRLAANIVDHLRIVSPLQGGSISDAAPVIQFLGEQDQEEGEGGGNAATTPGSSSPPVVVSDENLNQSQKTAVASALSQPVTLIQGPPGTGKTQVLSEIVKHAVACVEDSCKVLVVAQTNVAVDNAVRRLMGQVPVVRVGLEHVADDLRRVTIDGQLATESEETGKETSRRGDDGKQHTNKRMVRRVLQKARVVCATVSGAGSPVLKAIKCPFVIVDEATQCLEAALIPSLVHECRQLVLIGDTMQLPPLDPLRGRDPSQFGAELQHLSRDLGSSLFHRLSSQDGRGGIVPEFLNTQHRMHPAIAAFVSNEFYAGKLENGVTAKDRKPSAGFKWPNISRPVCYYDVNSREERHGTSYRNRAEALQVAKVVKRLLDGDKEVGPDSIAVLTPYAGQVQCVRTEIDKHVGEMCEVSTIDAFQGKETEYIVFTTVRANPHASLGFTGDAKRINVLLTRSRRGVIGVCDASTLRGSDIWERWLKQAHKC